MTVSGPFLNGRKNSGFSRRSWRSASSGATCPKPMASRCSHRKQQSKLHLLHYPVKVGDSAVYVRANEKWDVEVIQDGKVRISYDGQVLPQQYNKVPHYGCCDGAMFNPRSTEPMITVFGFRDGQ